MPRKSAKLEESELEAIPQASLATPAEPDNVEPTKAELVKTGPSKVFQAEPDIVEVLPTATQRVFHAGRWYDLQKGKPLKVSQDLRRVLMESKLI